MKFDFDGTRGSGRGYAGATDELRRVLAIART